MNFSFFIYNFDILLVQNFHPELRCNENCSIFYLSGILFLKKITIGSFCTILDTYFRNISRVRSLVINDMRLETNGFTPDASFVHR